MSLQRTDSRTPLFLALALAMAGAIVLYVLQPLPALVLANQLASDSSPLMPTWGDPWWIGAACAFGLVLGAGALRGVRLLRGRTWLIILSVLAYLAVPAVGVAIGSPSIVDAINWISVFLLVSFTYSLSGWISLLVATAFTLMLASRSSPTPQ